MPFVVLPSGLWRLASLFVEAEGGGGDGDLPSWLAGAPYMVLLSAVSELLAFTAVGLIAAWGEVFPRWVPWLRGRRVPVVATTVVGALAAVVLTVLWTALFLVTEVAGTTITGEPSPADYPGNVGGWFSVVYYVSYVPLMLWGPLLGAVVVAYWRRRRGEG
ncbi:hypothetical protein ACH4SP_41365 [Streptomyces sp. NPDC021093]|uniref:hypothetical protein n=1 Tax=Streptomyces sp. NPDC021093 TaxID=3365112 RepID=UPI0037A9E681